LVNISSVRFPVTSSSLLVYQSHCIIIIIIIIKVTFCTFRPCR